MHVCVKMSAIVAILTFEPPHEQTSVVSEQVRQKKIELYKHRRQLEAGNFGFISVAKTKMLISFAVSFAVTVKLICAFVFAYAKCLFSHDAAHLCSWSRSRANVSDTKTVVFFFYAKRFINSFKPGIIYMGHRQTE